MDTVWSNICEEHSYFQMILSIFMHIAQISRFNEFWSEPENKNAISENISPCFDMQWRVLIEQNVKQKELTRMSDHQIVFEEN